MKDFLKKYNHIWTIIYGFIYMPWFMILEKKVTTNFHLIYLPIDDKIPFCEYFIIPYLMWFLYVGATLVYLFFYSKKEYYRACAFLFTGMTVFLLICTIYPNGLNLRENIVYHDNIFCDMVKALQGADTCTNVFPSLHVFNSLGCLAALCHSEGLKNRKWIKILAGILTLFIILATMFLKQHSIVDVIGAFALALILYIPIYKKLV